MIYVDTDGSDWAERYDIQIQNLECPICKRKCLTCVPIRIKGYAGLETEDHGCRYPSGNKALSATFVPVDENEKQFWKQVF